MSDRRAYTEQDPLLSSEGPNGVEATEHGDNEPVSSASLSKLNLTAIIVCMFALIFLQAINISMLTTTQSMIAIEFNAFEETSWFTSAYLIAMSSITPIGGRLSKILSSRVYVTISAMIFSVGTVITAISPSFAIFLVGRAVSGIGAAGVMSVAIVLVLELATEKRRGLFIGMLNSGYTIGVSLGAVIAGAAAPAFGWRSVFWAQVPFSFLAGVGLFFALREAQKHEKKAAKASEFTLRQQLGRIDYAGAVTLIGTLVLFLFSLASPKILYTPLILSLLLFPLFLLIEGKMAREPIIPVGILRSRGTLLSCLATMALMISRWTVLFYSPVYAIAVRRWHPASAGLILLPTNGGFALGGLLVGWLHIKRAGSFYLACIFVMLTYCLSLFILSQISTTTSSVVGYVFATMLNGFCTGAALNYTLAHLLHLTHPSTHTIVSPLLAMFRGFAGSFGSSIGGGIFERSLKQSLEDRFAHAGLTHEEDVVRRLLGSPALASRLAGIEGMIARAGYVDALRTLFLSGVLVALIATLVQAGTGWHKPKDEALLADEEADGLISNGR